MFIYPLFIVFLLYRIKWNKATVDIYEKELGIINVQSTGEIQSDKQNNTTNKLLFSVPKYMAIVCGFPNKKIHDIIWEYLSIWALEKQNKDIKSFIVQKSKNNLKLLLETIDTDIDIMNDVKSSDYDLAYAKILGHTTPVAPINIVNGRKMPLLIEENAKRYNDIINSGVENIKALIKIKPILLNEAYSKMENINKENNLNNATDVRFVGIYINDWEKNVRNIVALFKYNTVLLCLHAKVTHGNI